MPTAESEQERTVVLAEKMAVLGTMVAGIVHEINTPSSAISAASVNAIHHIQALISTLMTLETLSFTGDQLPRILTLLQKMTALLDARSRRSSAEVRDEQKRLSGILEERGIPDGADLARQLARMGLGDCLDEVLALAESCSLDDLMLVLTHCHRIVASLLDIRISADMLLHDVGALKSYAHPGQQQPELLDVHATLDVALTILKNQFTHRIQVDCQYGELPLLLGYAGELGHVWINVLQNAIQSIEGEGRIVIETVALNNGEVGIKITDTGAGIPADVQPKIFDSHFTTKTQGQGTGLGLALVKQIITKHRGTITVASRPGQTVFDVHLPVLSSL